MCDTEYCKQFVVFILQVGQSHTRNTEKFIILPLLRDMEFSRRYCKTKLIVQFDTFSLLLSLRSHFFFNPPRVFYTTFIYGSSLPYVQYPLRLSVSFYQETILYGNVPNLKMVITK